MTVPVTPTTLLPVLLGPGDPQVSPDAVVDGFVGDLAVGYTPGPQYGRRLVSQEELAGYRVSRQEFRRWAAENLYAALDNVGVHGQPPALMLSFDGLESSVLLARRFWDDLAGAVPGELVVGVPARDVVIFTGAHSQSGLRKVRRAVDRVFYAGGPHPLTRDLLVRRQRRWEVFDPGPPPDPAPGLDPGPPSDPGATWGPVPAYNPGPPSDPGAPWGPVPEYDPASPSGLPARFGRRPAEDPPVSPAVPRPRTPLSSGPAR